MTPDLKFIPFPSRLMLYLAFVPRSTNPAAASPASSAGRRPGPLRGPDIPGDLDMFTRHGHVHRLVRLYPGEEPAQPLPRVPAAAELPTTTGFITVEAEVTARTAHLIHVVHTDETGKTLGAWLPPRLVRPRGTAARPRPHDSGGGEDQGQ